MICTSSCSTLVEVSCTIILCRRAGCHRTKHVICFSRLFVRCSTAITSVSYTVTSNRKTFCLVQDCRWSWLTLVCQTLCGMASFSPHRVDHQTTQPRRSSQENYTLDQRPMSGRVGWSCTVYSVAVCPLTSPRCKSYLVKLKQVRTVSPVMYLMAHDNSFSEF